MTTGERRDARHVPGPTGPASVPPSDPRDPAAGPGSPLSRRAALGALAALGATSVTGCSAGRQASAPVSAQGSAPVSAQGSAQAGTQAPTGSRTAAASSASPTPTPRLDPDVALAALVLREEQAMLSRIGATIETHPRLARALGGARTAHRAHVALLTRAVPRDQLPTAPSGGAARVPRRARAALTAVARAEAVLADSGRRHALTARSGAFARILASTSAAALQLSVQLADIPGPRR